MNKIIVTSLKTYNFTNEKNENIQGAKITYFTEHQSLKNNEVGYQPIQQSIALDKIGCFKEIPGLYKVDFSMVPGRNNKPSLEITDFNLLKSVDFKKLYE